MNKVILVGRLTKDPEVKNTASQVPFCNFTVAVDRRFKDANGQRQADFISCVAFGRTAEFIEKYFTKGNRIGVYGHIQTGSYTNKDGARVYTTDVVVDEAEFVESRSEGAGNAGSGFTAPASNQAPAPAGDGFMNIPDGLEEELPFN